MLVVKVELWPGGDEQAATEIGRAAIANISPLADVSDYLVIAVDEQGGGPQRVVRRHRRADGFWPLLARAFTPGSPGRLPARWRDVGRLMETKAGLTRPEGGRCQ